mmetsp:Transcript_5075/g.12579  ORF Transcript_5075/g.12579 Transcript_5075/m.12579 type:complete len:230 (+) Transcript_5075:180-869(+)
MPRLTGSRAYRLKGALVVAAPEQPRRRAASRGNVVVRAAVLQRQDTILRTETIRISVADRLALRREATKCVREGRAHHVAQDVLLHVVPVVECKHRRLAATGADGHNDFHEDQERGRDRARGFESLDDELATVVLLEVVGIVEDVVRRNRHVELLLSLVWGAADTTVSVDTPALLDDWVVRVGVLGAWRLGASLHGEGVDDAAGRHSEEEEDSAEHDRVESCSVVGRFL